MMRLIATLAGLLLFSCGVSRTSRVAPGETGFGNAGKMEPIAISPDNADFIYQRSGERFTPWGFNYDHDAEGRLLEDYWESEWDTVEADFREMRALGANVVRIHLQLGKFMHGPQEPNQKALHRLSSLLNLAETTGLYLDITGLGNYHRQDVPDWFVQLEEHERWDTQAAFWTAVASTCANSPAVFCYDLMNEPLWPSKDKQADWLAGELGGKFYCQRITLDLKGRDARKVAAAWVSRLTGAIRSSDKKHLITLGVIPWALTFPGAKPTFHAADVGADLDFVSVHFYPESGKILQAVEALKVYDLGKPLVIEEMFPLKSTVAGLDSFINASREIAEGYMGFYWGKTIEEHDSSQLKDVFISRWLEYFRDKTPEILP